MKSLILVATTLMLLAGTATAQWDLNETFDNGIPAGWTVTGGAWHWEENGGTFPTPYIWTSTPGIQTIHLIAGPFDIADAELLVFQFQYYVHSGGGDATLWYSYEPNGPWHYLTEWIIPSELYGIHNETFYEAQLQHDEMYFRWTVDFSPDGPIDEFALDNVRVSTQFPGWLEVSTDFPGSSSIPPEGRLIEFDMTVSNTFNIPIPNLQTSVLLQYYGDIYGPFNQQIWSIPAGETLQLDSLSFNFPSFAPAGWYFMTTMARIPGVPSLTFTDWRYYRKYSLVGESSGGQEQLEPFTCDWPDNSGENQIAFSPLAGKRARAEYDPAKPRRFNLIPAHPNPFNAVTTITVTLPESAELSLTVHNTLGQQVAELARGNFATGRHTFTLNGSSLASGIYFVRATVPGQLNTVQKIVLMK